MPFADFTVRDNADVLASLDSRSEGLTSAEARRRLEEQGPNAVDSDRASWLTVLRRQFVSPFMYLLLAAAVLSFLFGETFDGALIVLFISINTGLGFLQEYRSEKALAALSVYFAVRCRAVRDGKESLLEARSVVTGDIVILEAGDIAPADIRLLEETDLMMDESPLTGESVPIRKTHRPLAHPVTEPYEAANIVFSGTTVSEGRATGVVFATGRASLIGEIGALASETPKVSGFEQAIARFSNVLLRLVIATLGVVLLANVLFEGRSADLVELVIFSIALAVSIVPEALPVVMTFSLSRGAIRLAKHKVVVKRLSAIEDLGSIDVLCTDKTGTLTENVLTVAEIMSDDDRQTLDFAALGAPHVKGGKMPNNAFDLAIWRRLDAGGRKDVGRASKVAELPFDPERRRNSTLVERDGKRILVVRGAPESVLPSCTASGKSAPKSVTDWVMNEGNAGRRTLAVCWKPMSGSDILKEEQRGLRFAGVLSFVDPLKKDAAEAVHKAERLGVKVKILTGDGPEVAGTVGKSIGLIRDERQVITGAALLAMLPSERLRAVEDYAVFARVSPAQKHEIVVLLREGRHVGFLGEGINDAPALKAADVALVVNDASEVARSAADIVLLKKGLKVIIDGIHEGRETFANTMKYIRATLASNVGNFYAVAIASLFIPYLPLLPLQILLINLLTDMPMIAIATDNVDAQDLKRPKNYDIRGIILASLVLGLVSTLFDFIFFAVFSRMRPGALQANWFLGSVLTELAFMFSIRTRLSVFRAKGPSSPLFWLAICSAALAFAAVLTPFGQVVFQFTAPLPRELLLTVGIVSAYFIVSEKIKVLYYRGGLNAAHRQP